MTRFLFLLLLGLLPRAMEAQTAKALYCEDNSTLYFVYDTNIYTIGDTYTDDAGVSTTISKVYTVYHNYTYSPWYTLPGWYENKDLITTIDFQPSFKNFKNNSFSYWFYLMSALTTVKNESNLDTSAATRMDCMFRGCSSLTKFDVTFDTRNVTNMQMMFLGCSGLTSITFGSGFDMGKVTNKDGMFNKCNYNP